MGLVEKRGSVGEGMGGKTWEEKSERKRENQWRTLEVRDGKRNNDEKAGERHSR